MCSLFDGPSRFMRENWVPRLREIKWAGRQAPAQNLLESNQLSILVGDHEFRHRRGQERLDLHQIA